VGQFERAGQRLARFGDFVDQSDLGKSCCRPWLSGQYELHGQVVGNASGQSEAATSDGHEGFRCLGQTHGCGARGDDEVTCQAQFQAPGQRVTFHGSDERLERRLSHDAESTAPLRGRHVPCRRGLVNHRFGSKAALVEQLAQRVQSDFVSGLTNVEGDELTALVTVADTYLSTLAEADETTRAFFVMWGAALPSDAPLRPVFATDDARFRDTVRDVLADGQRHKTVNSRVDPAGAAVAVVGMLRGIAAQFLVNPDELDLAAAKSTVEQFIRSMGRELQPRKKR
jgi:AcrR family transcriptional regulator